MNNFNILDPLELYTYLDTILRTTKELCLDDEGIEFIDDSGAVVKRQSCKSYEVVR